MKILLVEDEEALAKGLIFNFELEGYAVEHVADGQSAIDAYEASAGTFDLIILDLMLPERSGYEVCRAVRAQDAGVPILVLSARTLSDDRTQAFDCGSDQYMTKPFELRELLSRVRNLTTRRRPQPGNGPRPIAGGSSVHRIGHAAFDFGRFEIRVGGQTHTLTSREAELLQYFVTHEGQVLSRAQIMADVWDDASDVTSRSIDNFVLRLRKLIEVQPADPRHILSVRGTGYRFCQNPFP